jgi:HEAT repeat protein
MNTSKIQAAAVCAALAFASQGRAADLPLPKDGWASWEVQAVEDSPAWCCWSSLANGVADTATCKLDDDRHGYGSRDNSKTDAIRVYARFKGGKVEKVRALDAACPVESKTPIKKLDNIATDDSARWLIGLAKAANSEFGEEELGALAMHRGAVSFDALSSMARVDPKEETRKRAIFWLAMLRGPAGADITTDAMFNDKSPEVRKHSAFAITQSKSPQMTANLTKLGSTDKDGDVRAQAWFWLAHTGAANVESVLIAASKKDQDDHVREQAIFALSQLPDERATPALIKAAEDRTLSREQRKRALFWLAQSQSSGAQAYLDKVLAGNAAR